MKGMTKTKGFAELLYFKHDISAFLKGDLTIQGLDVELYDSVLPSLISLDEIHSPYDIYTMYHAGVLDILSFDEGDNELELFELGRNPKQGDVILMHETEEKKTQAYMLVAPDTFPKEINKYYRAWRPPVGAEIAEGVMLPKQCNMILYSLNEHKGFQHRWKA